MKKAFTLIELLVCISIVAILAALIMPVGCRLTPGSKYFSEGTRAGIVTKLSYKGGVWKSWEGQLLMGGIAAGVQGNTWEFSIDKKDTEAVQKVQAALDSGERVRLYYHELKIYSPTTGDTTYRVFDVKPISAPVVVSTPSE